MPQWRQLEAIFQSEWDDLVLDEHYTDEANLPKVLVALNGSEVVAGLAFSRFKEPNNTDEVIWINALVVQEVWRGQGMAGQLLDQAVAQLTSFDQQYLYANTNVAPLYIKQGWFIVDTPSEVDHHIMAISLVPE